MTDTVFILGAGFSHSSGIPLLSGFVERMWEFSIRKTNQGKRLSSEDIVIFDEAMVIRNELDGYHGRAMFDDRNIEDILSILSFNMLGGKQEDEDKLVAMTRAITRTIDLCCTVEHSGITSSGQYSLNSSGPDLYRNFWKFIFDIFATGKTPPTIITFNYDLLLERSLFQTVIGTHFNQYDKKFPAQRIAINYNFDYVPKTEFEVNYTKFGNYNHRDGMIIKNAEPDKTAKVLTIDLLKLHGSLNFPKEAGMKPNDFAFTLTEAISDPFILPPIFNKMTNETPSKMWQVGLEKLRSAKNIVIVGYSLPQTDIYMQYFLKAALGPNLNLNKIFVFDPLLFSDTAGSKAMISRYESCFSPQIRSRIDFKPSTTRLNPLNLSPAQKLQS